MNNDPQDKRTAQELTDAARDVAQRATDTAKELAHSATTAAKDVMHQASDVVHQASDAARACCTTVSTKVEDGISHAQERLQQNPLAIVLGAVAVGIAIGCALALSRRAPTFRERFADDPVHATRDTLYAALAPVAQRLHEGYGSAGKAFNGLHRAGDSWANHLDRVGGNLKFW
jgi:ElaB/YqjD/DUF883 family membrane-anchored ribosome-binding protein